MRGLLIGMFLLSFALAGPAWGGATTTFNVNDIGDGVDAAIDGTCATVDGTCTLRAAIQEANAAPQSLARIVLPAGKYKLKIVGAREDAAATGDLDILSEIEIEGAGPDLTSIQGKKDRVFQVHASGMATVTGVTVSKGKLGKKNDLGDEFQGGAFSNHGGTIVLTNVVLEKNKVSDDGGAIRQESGDLVLVDVTIRKNKAGDDAAGIDVDEGTITMLNVTFESNKAKGEGGAIEVERSTVLVGENITFAKNKASETAALNVEQGGTATITNATFWKNKGKGDEAVTANEDAESTLTLINTIHVGGKPANCSGIIASGGGNVEDGSSCPFGAGDQSNVADPGLGNLGDHGGPTRTVELQAGSPAVDFGIDASCPATDQRGMARVGQCDSGAYELQ